MIDPRGYAALRAKVKRVAELWQKKYSNTGSVEQPGQRGLHPGNAGWVQVPGRGVGCIVWHYGESLAVFFLRFRKTSLHVLKHKLL